MELKRYLRVIRARWHVVVLVTLASIGFSAYLTSGSEAVYESSGTYIVQPRATEPGEAVAATDALNRGVEINTTYARIIRSDAIEDRAEDVLADDGLPTSGLGVRSTVLPGTNIIEITAIGDDPEVVAAYAAAVGAEMASYLEETGELFSLGQIDAPEVPDEAQPSRRTLTVALGGVFGIAAGAGTAFALEYLRGSTASTDMNIRDRLTGAYSEPFFRLRFRQELSRCDTPLDRPDDSSARRSTRKRVTMGIVELNAGGPEKNGSSPPRPIDLRDAAQSLMARFRGHDVVAYLGENRFGLILPDMSRDRARQVLATWRSGYRDEHEEVSASFSLCECDSHGVRGDGGTMRILEGV